LIENRKPCVFSENQAIQQILHRRSHKNMTPPDKS
jgi:hypothetical protein